MSNQAKAVAISNASRRKDITGHTFSSLTVVGYDYLAKKWLCSCKCGGSALVRTAALNNGNTKSCGCLQKSRASLAATQKHKATRKSRGVNEDTYLSNIDPQRITFMPLSKEILKRDNFTCAWCSQVGGQLNVHHIEPWAFCVERRLDPANLVTLCRACHLKVHGDNFHAEPNPYMSILLEGYSKEKEALS